MSDTLPQSESLIAWLPKRSELLDVQGRPLTQSLFLEVGYNEMAVYTLKDIDWEWKGKIYPSMKRLYLIEEDPTEYTFANKYLLGWNHWQRLCNNKLTRKHIDEWRDELEMKLRSRAVQEMMAMARKGNAGASKWLADKGWAKRGAGRPTTAEVDREVKLKSVIDTEYDTDVIRLRAG
jgi:hypothetical protein